MLSIIVAFDRNHLIGNQNSLPWHIPNDLSFFKRTTLQKKVIMGRKTYESIGNPLPKRDNFVLTQQKNLNFKDVTIIHSIQEIIEMDNNNEEIFIIGGKELYNQILPYITYLYITFIDYEFTGDTFFPDINLNNWNLIHKNKGEKDKENPYDYYFTKYKLKK